MSHNYTETENNGTHIIIKQIFLSVDPDTYVTWDGLYATFLYWMFWYFMIRLIVQTSRRKGYCCFKKQEEQQVVAIVADPENVRVINNSGE